MKNKFTFKGFEPDDKLRTMAQVKYDDLYGVVPCDSVPRLSVEKSEGLFSGRGIVVSQKKTFSVEVSGESASSVVEEIYSKLENQIVSWKKARFL